MNLQLLNKQITGLVVGILILRFFGPGAFFDAPQNPVAMESEDDIVIVRPSPFDDLELQAAAAYVLDVRDGNVLFAKNEHAQLPLASLTKLMTALVVRETFNPGDLISIQDQSLAQEGDTGFFTGEQLTMQGLVDLTLVASSNDGAHALASALVAFPGRRAFSIEEVPELMNARAEELGLTQTYFANATGLDINDAVVGGAYGSAQDVGTTLVYILKQHPDILEATRQDELVVRSINGFVHDVKNTNVIVDDIPWLVGSKTGFTDLAGGNLAIVFDAGLARPIIAVVLGSTKDERFADIQKLVDTTFEHYASL